MLAFGGKLSSKITAILLLVLTLTSLIFLFLFLGTYHLQLQSERRQASEEVNLLLQASLENAMLKRDLQGLQDIVDRLGMQAAIIDVSILNTVGEIRFSSNSNRVGANFEQQVHELCPGCLGDFSAAESVTRMMRNEEGLSVFRSINPVRNKEACISCHGPVSSKAVNGILIVDYDAGPIIQKTLVSVTGLVFSGMTIMIMTLGIVWWFMRKHIVRPLDHLKQVSEQLAQGDLSARSTVNSSDEFSDLGKSFNLMAERLGKSLQQMLEKENYLQALIDAIPDGIRVIDRNFKVLNANKAYREHLQLNEDEAIQACCYHASHQRQEPCIPTLITCPVSKLMDHSLPVKTMQNFIRKNGEYSMVQVFAAPLEIVSADGKEVHVVESIRDLQTDINFSHEQKLSLLGQLAAGVAHEIRNPLGSIRIALQSIMKKLKSDSLDYNDTMHYLELVDGEIDKCVSVTERMLKFSSFPSDQRELVDVNQAIRDVLTLLDFERADKGIQVIKILDDSEPRILASESDIRMLFINLVQNAFHALYKGGELTVRSVVSEEQVTVDFLDNGPGIPYEYKAHIFEPFFSRRPDGRKGTGLGLTISKSIAERYGGTIMVRDVSPSGAQFIVTLPLPDRMEVSATVSS